MATILLRDIAALLDKELNISQFADVALNGLQIESPKQEISKVAFAVDSGLSVIKKALACDAQLLVVHHGAYWGKVEPLVGVWAKKAALCLGGGLSLYAVHLPLDGHPVLGNAAQIATTILGALNPQPDFAYQGSPVGCVAQLTQALEIDEIATRLSMCDGVTSGPLVLPF
jgi:putative NIF3 family GTP cyclohydrolase 1 type 2